jgi:hypothetical protein
MEERKDIAYNPGSVYKQKLKTEPLAILMFRMGEK